MRSCEPGCELASQSFAAASKRFEATPGTQEMDQVWIDDFDMTIECPQAPKFDPEEVKQLTNGGMGRNEAFATLWKGASNRYKADMGTYDPEVILDPETMEATLEEPSQIITQLTCAGVEQVAAYPRDVAYTLGEDFIPPVGGTELSKDEIMLPENKEDFRAAHKKEIDQMTNRRFVRPGSESAKSPMYIPPEELTEEQKRTALPCRLSYTRKRPELGQAKSDGAAKARLVAKDLKVKYLKPKESTYSPVPSAEALTLCT